MSATCLFFLRVELIPGLTGATLLIAFLSGLIQWRWGWEIHKRAWKSAKRLHITMDTFMSFNTSFCYVFSCLMVLLSIYIAHSQGSSTHTQMKRYAVGNGDLPVAGDIFGIEAPLSNGQTEFYPVPGFNVSLDTLMHDSIKKLGIYSELGGAVPFSIPASGLLPLLENMPPEKAEAMAKVGLAMLQRASSSNQRSTRRRLRAIIPVHMPRLLRAVPVSWEHSHGHNEINHYFETAALLITIVLWGKVRSRSRFVCTNDVTLL